MIGDGIKGFFTQPYTGAETMSAWRWFLFVGLLIVIVILWNFVLREIRLGEVV